jgi:hypothetical protein
MLIYNTKHNVWLIFRADGVYMIDQTGRPWRIVR